MTTIEALKNLAAKICGVKVDKVTGATTAEVIQFMANNYKAPSK